MAVLGYTGPEIGAYVNLSFDNGMVTKTSQILHPQRNAESTVRLLRRYSRELADEPIPVARLEDAGLVPVLPLRDLFHIQHTVEMITGPNVRWLPPDEREQAVQRMIGYLCSMETIEDERPGRLRVPVDAGLRNWHMNGDIPTLVDIYPPLSRGNAGMISIFHRCSWTDRKRFEESFGMLGSIVPELLIDTAPRLPERETLDWCLSMLPNDISRSLSHHLEQQTRQEVTRHFDW
jgi:hypothetical protein